MFYYRVRPRRGTNRAPNDCNDFQQKEKAAFASHHEAQMPSQPINSAKRADAISIPSGGRPVKLSHMNFGGITHENF